MGARLASDPLGRYRSKRRASSTPEPFSAGRSEASRPTGGLFVVQKHAARRLHYDFRLEHRGVLLSWAVPKGPSVDPRDKRMAVHVEDHPLEYADFEGVIPAGNYGAGAVIVWDRGSWRPLEDPDEGLAKGKLLFELSGYKLRGVWTLVRMRRDPKSWLLIRHRDAAARQDGERPYPEQSVLSGRSLEDLAAGRDAVPDLAAELERLGAPRRRVDAQEAKPMLAESREKPFSGPGWIFELKYDGFRMRAAREGRETRLLHRSGRDATLLYPEIARALGTLPHDLLIDGEVVVLDRDGRPTFQDLQRRALLSPGPDVTRAAAQRPATLFAFDLLALAGFDLRPLPLAKRKEILARVAPRAGPIRYADHVEERGEELFREARALGIEGVVAKRADTPYRSGRSSSWVKVRGDRTGDFVVVGFTAPKGTRAGFGALHLASAGEGGLVYSGSVGTGFSAEDLAALHERLSKRLRPSPPCSGPVPNGRGNSWVDPELVCEVRYLEWTEEGLLRQPVFIRLRDDKPPQDCAPPRPSEERAGGRPEAGPGAHSPPRPELSNLGKVYWPGDGITKGELVDYYRAVAPWLLPYLRDRPLTLTRFPDGIEGKSFFQKDAPEWTPAWVRTEKIWSEDTERDVAHFVCDDVDSLTYVANLGTIPLHVTASRIADQGRPDWFVVDLDPKQAPFAHVIQIARRLRDLCEEIGLPSFVKTTGQAGLHVLVPLGGQCTHDQARDLALLLARQVVDEMPDVATIARSIAARGGRVYLDCLQNARGKTIVAPFSVRPRPGATVSAPLRWSEVNGRLDPRRFTIRTVPSRMRRLGEDPLRPLLTLSPDLVAAIGRLQERVRGAAAR